MQLKALLSLPFILSPLAAQTRPSDELLDAFHVDAATLQRLRLPRTAGAFQVAVNLGGVSRTLVLEPHSLLAGDFKLLVADEDGVREVASPPPDTYRGQVVGERDSVVAASLRGGQLIAHVHTAGRTWTVQPVNALVAGWPQQTHIVYATGAVRQVEGHCGVTDGFQIEGGGHQTAAGALKVAEIGIDADFEYYQRNGSDVVATRNRVVDIMNAVSAIYEVHVDVRYQITVILVRTSNFYRSTDVTGVLREFQNHWNSSQRGIQRDVAHVFTGVGSFTGVVGVAYLGVICDRSNGYAASKAYHGTFDVNVGLVAHELGHNWNAGHCNASGICRIMCSILGGCSNNLRRFAPVTVQTIRAYRSSLSCLSDPGTVPGSYTPFGSGCQGSNGSAPRIDSTLVPNVGRTFYVNVTDGRANAPVVLFFGASNTSWNGLGLPLDMVVFGAAGCFLRVSLDLPVNATTDGNGSVSVPIPVPANAALVGAVSFNQAFVNDPAANTLGWVVTGGGQATIGNN